MRNMSSLEKVIFIFAILLFGGIGVAFFVPGLVNVMRCNKFTQATVIHVDVREYEDRETNHTSLVYLPTISYEIDGMKYINTIGNEYSNSYHYSTDQIIMIRYYEKDPNVFVVNNRMMGLELKNLLGLFFILFTTTFGFRVNKMYIDK